MADGAKVTVLRPLPEKMADFLPWKNKRDAHIAARDNATMRRQVMAGEDTVSKSRLQELDDEIEMHKQAIIDCEAEMRKYQFEAQD